MDRDAWAVAAHGGGDVRLAAPSRQKSPKLRRGPMTEHRARPTGKDCRHQPHIWRERQVTHGVYRLMHTMQLAARDARVDRSPPHTPVQQLAPGDEAVLLPRKQRKRSIHSRQGPP